MSIIPAFEIGLWNAWIFTVAFIVFHAGPTIVITQISKDLKKRFSETPANPPYNKTERKIEISAYVILCLLSIYSIFLPLPLGTLWFYTGLAIFIVGAIMSQIAGVPWATTPLEQPVTKGLYRYSRHPIYFAMFIQLIGVGIASASWLFLSLSIVFIILMNILVKPEERFCCETYGNAYREYMDRTPRWIGIPKSAKTL